MSKRNEDRDVFFIPPNFLTSGRLFGGSIRFRNAIEASILVLITAFPIIKLPLDLTPKIMLLCLLPLPLGIFGVLGVEGESLSEFVLNWLKWLTNRRTAPMQKMLRKERNSGITTKCDLLSLQNHWVLRSSSLKNTPIRPPRESRRGWISPRT